MKRFPGRQIAAVGLAAVALLSAGCSAAASQPAGTRDFSLPSLSHPGQAISLAGYQGQPLIVTFFGSWCPSCQRTARMIAHYYRIYHGKATIIGVDSSDPRREALSFVQANRIGFPVAADRTLGTASAYGTVGLPATYFLDAQHKVIASVLGVINWQQLRNGTVLIHNPAAGITLNSPGT